ncbi:hypothetical protein [Pseudomonas frederiksbergensis]|uniref:Uncharacterized protein n=1 Tax=Pseudomonas frederiksbergensis TaxID=104087 RepID=A0A423HF13_9PSED|nr:hypothetical protein [Pseudomonas frederiksbergensis]RON11798.1 hypothetical protein BK662_31690 [Pseudomonas frederiksbergensis]
MGGYSSEWVGNQGQHKDEYGLLALPCISLIVTSHLAAQEKEIINRMFTWRQQEFLNSVAILSNDQMALGFGFLAKALRDSLINSGVSNSYAWGMYGLLGIHRF